MAKARYRNECEALGEGRRKQRLRKSFTYRFPESVAVGACDCKVPFSEMNRTCWKVANLHSTQESFQQGRCNDTCKCDTLTAGTDSIFPPTRFHRRLMSLLLLYQSLSPLAFQQQSLADPIYALIVAPEILYFSISVTNHLCLPRPVIPYVFEVGVIRGEVLNEAWLVALKTSS